MAGTKKFAKTRKRPPRVARDGRCSCGGYLDWRPHAGVLKCADHRCRAIFDLNGDEYT